VKTQYLHITSITKHKKTQKISVFSKFEFLHWQQYISSSCHFGVSW